MTVPGQGSGPSLDDGSRDGRVRVLLITNDFPPRQGGIESYLRDFCGTLDPDSLTVLASTRIPGAETRDHDAALPYRVHRLRDRVLLPLPHVARAAAKIIADEGIDVEGVESQLIGTAAIVCNDDDSEFGRAPVPAVAGQLVSQGRTDKSVEDVTAIIEAAAKNAYC